MNIIFAIANYIYSSSFVRAGFVDRSKLDQSGLERNSVNFVTQAGFDRSFTIFDMIKVFIDAFIGLFGMIFLGMVLWAGYKWFNAEGDEAKVKEAKKIIGTAVMGLVITMSIYAITYFVFNIF